MQDIALDLDLLRDGFKYQIGKDATSNHFAVLVNGLPGHLPLPSLILQPLLENAIYHGIERLSGGGRISLYSEAGQKRLQIHIENPVPDAHDSGGPEHRGNKLAQDNVSQRLSAFFEQSGLLRAGRENGLYRVTVSIPYGNENTDRR